jgi:hypothetical protein
VLRESAKLRDGRGGWNLNYLLLKLSSRTITSATLKDFIEEIILLVETRIFPAQNFNFNGRTV